jgi:capsular polysaccharide biosynthesis protein
MTGAYNPYGFTWLREKFAPYFQSGATGKAVFLTRRRARRTPNHLAEIENIFSKRGFLIVDCGAFSVKEQIRIVSSATAIAGLHGAAMTNLLWARPKTPVLEIFSPNWLNAVYEQIALHGGLDYSAHIIEQSKCFSFFDGWCHSIGS